MLHPRGRSKRLILINIAPTGAINITIDCLVAIQLADACPPAIHLFKIYRTTMHTITVTTITDCCHIAIKLDDG